MLEGKLKQRVIHAKDQALLSKKLAKIVVDVPIKLNLDALHFVGPNLETLSHICDELEFKRIFDRIANKFQSKMSTPPPLLKKSGQLNIFDLDQDEISSSLLKGTAINSITSLKKLIPLILNKKAIAISVCCVKENIISLSISHSVNQSDYIIFNDTISFSDCLKTLLPVLESPIIEKLLFLAK